MEEVVENNFWVVIVLVDRCMFVGGVCVWGGDCRGINCRGLKY